MSLFRKDRRPDETTSASLYAATVIAAARTLRNRRTDLLVRECERALELDQSLTLLYLAIRDWEGVAHTLGEKQVAVVVQELEQVLRGTLRVTDLFLRAETGYFTILLPGTLVGDVPTVARNLRQAVRSYRAQAPDGADYYLKLIADVGAASLPEDGTEPEALRELALQRLQESSHQPDPSGEDDALGGAPKLRLVA